MDILRHYEVKSAQELADKLSHKLPDGLTEQQKLEYIVQNASGVANRVDDLGLTMPREHSETESAEQVSINENALREMIHDLETMVSFLRPLLRHKD